MNSAGSIEVIGLDLHGRNGTPFADFNKLDTAMPGKQVMTGEEFVHGFH
jgi:hypothetical protein